MGVAPDLRRDLFRVDDAGQSYARSQDTKWYRRVAYSFGDWQAPAAEPWTPPSRTITPADIDNVLQAIASANPPISPRLSDDARSFKAICRQIGVTSKPDQEALLADLRAQHGVTVDKYRPQGRGPDEVRLGLRCRDGQPYNGKWIL
jgi:hypothetical protein